MAEEPDTKAHEHEGMDASGPIAYQLMEVATVAMASAAAGTVAVARVGAVSAWVAQVVKCLHGSTPVQWCGVAKAASPGFLHGARV